MSTRIVENHRIVWRSANSPRPRDWSRGKPQRIKGRGALREVTPVDCTVAIAPTDTRSPMRAGIAMRDSDEDVVYRVVHHLAPTDGWASTDFWQDRYKLPHEAVMDLVRFGFLDAAIETDSQVRRYRCRDETRMKASSEYKTLRTSEKHRKHNHKRAKARRAKPWADD